MHRGSQSLQMSRSLRRHDTMLGRRATAYHPDYYAAFVLDPDGNNIEAVYHGEAKRSAARVTVTF
jgi:hypothetical protein